VQGVSLSDSFLGALVKKVELIDRKADVYLVSDVQQCIRCSSGGEKEPS
jgi:hypothetical protein